MELVYILQNRVEKSIAYFFNRLYAAPFFFNFGAPRYCLDFFRFAQIYNFCILHERAYGVGVYTPKQSRIWRCIFILTYYIQSCFVFNIGVPR